MAVRVNANSDDILYTAGTIGENAFTAMMWFYISVDRNDYSNIFWFGQDAYGDDGCVDVFLDGGDGVSISAGIRNYNTPQISTAEALAVGNWYHLTLSGSAATGQPFSLRVYRLSNNTQNTYNGTSGALGTWPAGAAGKIQLMMASAGSGNVWSNGRCQGFKIWDGVALTDAQIGWERWFANPVFEQANCYAAWPLFDATDTRETMGTGRAPTLTGLQTEDGPPLLWTPGGSSRIWRSAPAAGGAITGSTAATFSASGVLTGAGALAGTAAMAFAPSAALAGAAALTGSVSLAFSPTATLAGAGALLGSAAASFSTSGSIAGAGALTGQSAIAFSTTGALAGAGALAGTSALSFSITGTLSSLGSGAMSGASAAAFSTAGVLTGSGALSGASALSFSATALMTGAGALSGISAAAFGTTGALTNGASGALNGAASFGFSTTGALIGAGAISGTADVVFSATAIASGAGALAGSASLAFSASGTLFDASGPTGVVSQRTVRIPARNARVTFH